MSRWSKLRAAPRRFFADSKRPAVRTAGRVITPLLESPAVASLVEEPSDAVLRWMSPSLSRPLRSWGRTRRHSVLAAAGWPTVSVVVPAHEAGATLRAALESLGAQSYSQLEVLVVDDGSEDDTSEVARACAAEDPRIQVVRCDGSHGAAVARNVGMHLATGAYLTFLDADDRSHPERVERQLAALLRSDASLTTCNLRREESGGRLVVINGSRFRRGPITMLFPRQRALDAAGFMRPLHVGEDSEFYHRVALALRPRSPVHLERTLYLAGYEPDSLFFSSGDSKVHVGRELHVDHRPFQRHDEALDDAVALLKRGHLSRIAFDPPTFHVLDVQSRGTRGRTSS